MKCVILGAGKIARGFIGHLLYLSEIPFIFIEKSDALTELLNRRGQYTVNILGNSGKNCVVKGAKAVCLQDEEQADHGSGRRIYGSRREKSGSPGSLSHKSH